MSRENELRNFLSRKDDNILRFYDTASSKMKKSLERIYKACYRYALTDTQIVYLLDQAIIPYKNDKLLNLMDDQ